MPTDLRVFVSRVLGIMAMALAPVLLLAFLTLPSSLHHHIGKPAADVQAFDGHMT